MYEILALTEHDSSVFIDSLIFKNRPQTGRYNELGILLQIISLGAFFKKGFGLTL